MPFSNNEQISSKIIHYCGVDITDEFDKLGVDVYIQSSRDYSLPSMIIFRNDEDRNLYRLCGTIKEDNCMSFTVVNF